MEMLMPMFVLIVMLSRLGNTSPAFKNVANDNGYSSTTNIPFNLRGFENNIEEANKPLPTQPISVGNIEEIEKFGKKEIKQLDKIPSLSRKVRCKYPRSTWKSRRAKKLLGVPANPLKSVSALKSTITERRTGNVLRKPNFQTASLVNIGNPLNTLSTSKTTKRENEQIQKIMMLQPRVGDTVVLINDDPSQHFDESDKTTKPSYKQLTPHMSFKEKNLAEIFPKTRQSEQKIQENSVEVNDLEATHPRQDSPFPQIPMKESTISKRLAKNPSPSCVLEPTVIREPMKIGIPLNGNQESNNFFYQRNGKWYSGETSHNLMNNRQMRPEMYPPFGINKNNHCPDLISCITQKHITYPTYTEKPMYQDTLVGSAIRLDQPLSRDEQSVPGQLDVSSPPVNVMEMEKCIELYGLEHCIPIPGNVRSYVPHSLGNGAYDPKIDLQSVPSQLDVSSPPVNFVEMEKCIELYGLEHCIPTPGNLRSYVPHNLGNSAYDPKIDLQHPGKISPGTADSYKSGINRWNYPTSDLKPEKSSSNYGIPGAIEVNGITLDFTVPNSAIQSFDQLPIPLFQLTNPNFTSEPDNEDQDSHFSTTAKYVFVNSAIHETEPNSNDNHYINTSTPPNYHGQDVDHTSVSEDPAETEDYYNDSNKLGGTGVTASIEEAIVTGYPELSTQEESKTYQRAHDQSSFHHKNMEMKSIGSDEDNYLVNNVTEEHNQSYQDEHIFDEMTHERGGTNFKEETTKSHNYMEKHNQMMDFHVSSDDGIELSEETVKRISTTSIPDIIENKDMSGTANVEVHREHDNLSNSKKDNSRAANSENNGLMARNTPVIDRDDYSEEITLRSDPTKNEDTSKYKEKIQSNLESLEDQTQTNTQNNDASKNQYGTELTPKDKEILESLLGQAVNNFKKAASSNSSKGVSPSSQLRLTDEMAVARRLLLIPDVQYLVLQDAKLFISDISDLTKFGLSMARVADDITAMLLMNVLDSLAAALESNLLPVPEIAAELRSTGQATLSNAELKDYITNLIKYSGITSEEAKSEITENILFRTIEHSLTNAGIKTNKMQIWEVLKSVISGSKLPRKNSIKNRAINERVSMIRSTGTPAGSTKRLPIIPVKERVFKDGRWLDKNTFLGSTGKPVRPKGSLKPTSTKKKENDSELTTRQIDHKLLGNPESRIHKELNTDNSNPGKDTGTINSLNDPMITEPLSTSHRLKANDQENEKIPIKYYSPTGRLLAYRKKIQAPKVIFQSKKKTTISPQVTKFNTIKNSSLSPAASITRKFTPTTHNVIEVSKPFSESRILHISNLNLPSHEKFDEKPGYLSSSERDKKAQYVDKDILGIVNFSTVTEYVPTPDDEEYSMTARNKVELTTTTTTTTTTTKDDSVKNFGKIKKNSTYRKSLIKTTTESILNSAKNLNSRTRYRKISNKRVDIPQDKISGNKKSSLIERSIVAAPEYNPTYFGKISLNAPNSQDKISDLMDTDLFYIGDGVKIPLKLTKMSDDSWGLSISEKICDNFVKHKCPHSVPNEGDIVEERGRPKKDISSSENTTQSKAKNHNFLLNETGSSMSIDSPKERRTRSFLKSDHMTTNVSPVTEFVKRYNLTLNPENVPRSLILSRNSTTQINNTGTTQSRNNAEFSSTTPIPKISINSKRINSEIGGKYESQMNDDEDLNETSKRSIIMEIKELPYSRKNNEFPESLSSINVISEAQIEPESFKIDKTTKIDYAKFNGKSSDGSMNSNIAKNPRITSNYQEVIDSGINDLSKIKIIMSENPIVYSTDPNDTQQHESIAEDLNIDEPKLLEIHGSSKDQNDAVIENPIDDSTKFSSAKNVSHTKNYQITEEPELFTINNISQIGNEIEKAVSGIPRKNLENPGTLRELGSMLEHRDIYKPNVPNIHHVPGNEIDQVFESPVNDSLTSDREQNLSHLVNYQNIAEPKFLKTIDESMNLNAPQHFEPMMKHLEINKPNLLEVNILPETESAKITRNSDYFLKTNLETVGPKLSKNDTNFQTTNGKVMGRWSWVHDLVDSNVHNSAPKHDDIMNSRNIDKSVLRKFHDAMEAENAEVVESAVDGSMNFNFTQSVSSTTNYQPTIESKHSKNRSTQTKKVNVTENSVEDTMHSEKSPKIHTAMKHQIIDESKLSTSEATNASFAQILNSGSKDFHSKSNYSPTEGNKGVLQPKSLKINDPLHSTKVLENVGDGTKNSNPVKNLNPTMDYQDIVVPKILKIENLHQTENAAVVEHSIYSQKILNPVQNNIAKMKHQNTNKPKNEISKQNQKKSNEYEYDDYDFNIMTNEMPKYDYQKDNLILKRIRFMKEKQLSTKPYRYQKYIDDEAQERMDVMKTVLHWLKEVFFEPTALSDD